MIYVTKIPFEEGLRVEPRRLPLPPSLAEIHFKYCVKKREREVEAGEQ